MYTVCVYINIVFIFYSTRDATYNNEEGSVRMFLRGRPINLYAPTADIATYDITKVATAPSSKLKLDWVYPLLNINVFTVRLFASYLYFFFYHLASEFNLRTGLEKSRKSEARLGLKLRKSNNITICIDCK